jgi:hypothetical protein
MASYVESVIGNEESIEYLHTNKNNKKEVI